MIGSVRRTLPVVLALFALEACGSTQAEVVRQPEAQAVPEGKLPEGVRPTSYRLSLEVIPERDTFSGYAMITIELDEPSDVIWMHGDRLDVTSIHATHATSRIDATWSQQTSYGVARVDFRETLPAGRSTLHVAYVAPFDTPLRGLYKVRAGGEAYAFTQFESISARLAFPCFDEPRFKTPFEITLTVLAEHFAAANTPVDRAIALPGGLQRVTFAPTPPLPTYLVAFVVGPFDVVDGPAIAPHGRRPFAIPLRGIAAKGQGARLQYALGHTAQFVLALEDYFGIPYPYRKLDLVAVPDFAAGAMENVGLITFREWLLLLDEQGATEGQRRAFAYVMAHELAHQWFGNLVTMPWWDDIWLNEAFATWMGNKIVQELNPDLRTELASLTSAHRAMDLDSLTSARAIRQPIVSNHDIKNAFDVITYEKGGAVLAMFEHWTGEETFREGIRRYLRRHREHTATSADLLTALDAVTELDVTPAFDTFLNQPGVPLLSVEMDGSGCTEGARRLTLGQTRYLPIGSTGSTEETWQIPYCIRHAEGTTCGLLDAPRGSIDLPGCPTWWMPNEEGAGYFRFTMPPSDWSSLRRRGFTKLSDRGKIAVGDSLYAGFDRGALEADALLPWFSRFAASPLRQVAVGPMSVLEFMMEDGASPASRPRVRAYAARLYRNRYEQLGWRALPRDSSDTKLLREAVVRFMVMDIRDPRARARAARLGKTYMGLRATPRPQTLDPQLVGLALATAVQEGNETVFDHLVTQLDASADATARARILIALGHAEDPALGARALRLALDPRVRVNEISALIGTQFRNPRTRDRAWQWLTEHFDALVARMGASQAGSLPWYAAGMCSEEAANEVRAFFEPRVSELAGGPRNLAASVEAISLCAAKVEAQRAGIDRAFAVKRP